MLQIKIIIQKTKDRIGFRLNTLSTTTTTVIGGHTYAT